MLHSRGFTRLLKADYVKFRDEGRLLPDGSNVRVITHKGPLSKKEADQIFPFAAIVYGLAQHKPEDE